MGFIVFVCHGLAASISVVTALPFVYAEILDALEEGAIQKANGWGWLPDAAYALACLAHALFVRPYQVLSELRGASPEDREDLVLFVTGAFGFQCLIFSALLALAG